MPPFPRCADLPLRFCCLGIGFGLAACAPNAPDPAGSPRGTTARPSDLQAIDGIPAGSPSHGALQSGDHAITRNSVSVTPSGLGNQSPPSTPLRARRLRAGGITLTVFTFDGRAWHLAVVDNENGAGTGAGTAGAAAHARNAPAAINAGFFTPEGRPLGLVIEDGRSFGSINFSPLGAGIYSNRSGNASLVRRTEWSRSPPPHHLVQSGPFLLENRVVVPGLSDSPSRPRSFLLWDGRHGWAIGHAASTSLAHLATTLAKQPIPGFSIKSALNLDGGTSADLWISSAVNGGPASTRRFWNKPVRNYLVVQPNRP